jgi:predicted metal-dependent hydrolase
VTVKPGVGLFDVPPAFDLVRDLSQNSPVPRELQAQDPGNQKSVQLELDLAETLPLVWVCHPRARRYVLRVLADGTVRITLPRGGSRSAALAFLQRKINWIRHQRQRRWAEKVPHRIWEAGAEVLYRGMPVRLVLESDENGSCVRWEDQTVRIPAGHTDLRPFIERQMRQRAIPELMGRTLELARLHGERVRRVSIRNQRSRWGSCSARGTISLNWRLIQVPPAVRDYLILHELAHLKHPNHSARFWRRVAELCPHYRESDAWLKQQGRLLR